MGSGPKPTNQRIVPRVVANRDIARRALPIGQGRAGSGPSIARVSRSGSKYAGPPGSGGVEELATITAMVGRKNDATRNSHMNQCPMLTTQTLSR